MNNILRVTLRSFVIWAVCFGTYFLIKYFNAPMVMNSYLIFIPLILQTSGIIYFAIMDVRNEINGDKWWTDHINKSLN